MLARLAPSLPHATPMQRLEAFTRFHIRFNLDRPDAVFMSYMELRNLSPRISPPSRPCAATTKTSWKRSCRAGRRRGFRRAPTRKIATMAMIAMLTGVNTWYPRRRAAQSRDRRAEVYWDMVRKSVAA